jgi:hypothetical protein
VDPKAILDGFGKPPPPLGFDPQAVQPVANCYTDCAIPAQLHQYGPDNMQVKVKVSNFMKQVMLQS